MDVSHISKSSKCDLMARFTEEEIKLVATILIALKSLGPMDIHYIDRVVKGSNSFFIVLIPKIRITPKIGGLTPILLIRCMYKVLTKNLASSSRKIRHTVISESQSTFVNSVRFYMEYFWQMGCSMMKRE
ncbi:hypothetical protein CR513_09177, partial [Mucuna pruriens]